MVISGGNLRMRSCSYIMGSRMPARLLALSLLWLVLLAGRASADGGWIRLEEKSGVLVERRDVAGSSWSEYRARTRSPLPAVQIFAALRGSRLDEAKVRKVVQRYDVRKEGGGGRTV